MTDTDITQVVEIDEFRQGEVITDLREDHGRLAKVLAAMTEYIGRADGFNEMGPYLHTLAEVALALDAAAGTLEYIADKGKRVAS
ncbi:MAG TPA: hypothetical protein VM324_08620 [Egibacteraceae bacterium]|jgi:hypothetical protein|nr:hypothetical protein [Egibacteraceae bacterium]